MEPRYIAIANQKGGIGKTTTSLNVGLNMALFHGLKVLLVDLDPQLNLTETLIGKVEEGTRSAYHLMLEAAKTESYLDIPEGYNRMKACDVVINVRENVDLLAGTDHLEDASLKFASVAGREYLLKDCMDEFALGYDVVIFDCPATFELLTLNAFCTGADVYVPCECEGFATKGFIRMIKKIKNLTRMAPSLNLKGVIPTKFRKGEKLAKHVRLLLKKNFGELILDAKIHENTKVRESPAARKSVHEYAPTSVGAADYKHLTKIMVGE